MSCYLLRPLIRMARNIRHIRARAQPVPFPFLFIFAPIIAHFSRKSFL